MKTDDDAVSPPHPAVVRFRQASAAKVASTTRQNRVNMEAVLGAFSDESRRQPQKSPNRWQRLLSLRGVWARPVRSASRSTKSEPSTSLWNLLRIPFPLVGAGAALVLLVAVVTTQYRGGRDQFMSLDVPGERSGTTVNPLPLSGRFTLELSSKMESIRVNDSQLSFKGALIRQSSPAADVVILNFTAKSTTDGQQPISIKDGVLKLRLKDPKASLSKSNIAQGHISGILLPEQRPLERDFFP